MHILQTRAELHSALQSKPRPVLVPTMGNLHAGHLALVARARELGSTVIASVFVNRLQFGPGEDFERYPRTLQRDAEQLRLAGCDLLFAPDEAQMYPAPQTFHVRPDPLLAGELEGASRPGHFEGVTTVVLKLLQLVQPGAAVFGKKDYQQLLLIRAMVEQFALPVRVEGVETVREADGLAMSSRNGYLDASQRAQAPQLHQTLRELAQCVRAGCRADELRDAEAAAEQRLRSQGWQPDYASVRRRRDLQRPQPDDLARGEPLVALGAARLGTTRLLDNLEI
jgi:pantoate--beta-alanine ligase